jgi:hypothetical protein
MAAAGDRSLQVPPADTAFEFPVSPSTEGDLGEIDIVDELLDDLFAQAR